MHKSSTVTPFDLNGTEPSLASLLPGRAVLPFLGGSRKLNITWSTPPQLHEVLLSLSSWPLGLTHLVQLGALLSTIFHFQPAKHANTTDSTDLHTLNSFSFGLSKTQVKSTRWPLLFVPPLSRAVTGIIANTCVYSTISTDISLDSNSIYVSSTQWAMVISHVPLYSTFQGRCHQKFITGSIEKVQNKLKKLHFDFDLTGDYTLMKRELWILCSRYTVWLHYWTFADQSRKQSVRCHITAVTNECNVQYIYISSRFCFFIKSLCKEKFIMVAGH